MAGCCFIRKGAGVLAGILINFLLVLFLGLGSLPAVGAEWSVYRSGDEESSQRFRLQLLR